ncbi:HAMP domain-containing histidine kinase [Luteolibacter ambystomatis]|uniref:histidine kinase n=1 Tax=Luteolibacter ambystomatis TaxID=2824561 RepID=A0A975PGZ9_9BACT|nr:HAMP domain-containing sensor histidine kinase [Luteolibacter ambystomatis]QUE53095.1 HAMP domain-containing histidine kinase [Luteolibacter ambystomatis]
MRAPSPAKTLLLLWGIAAVVLAGGLLLARQERQVRTERDRTPLRAFATTAQGQLQRLEDLYQDHLVRLGREVVPDPQRAGRMADEITGILQISLLHPTTSGVQDTHIPVNASPDGPVPLPAFATAPGLTSGSLVLLDESRLFNRDSGWVDEPGKPLLFHVRRSSSEVAVIAVSRSLVADSITGWLRAWAEKSFAPVRVTGGPDQLRAEGRVLAGAGEAAAADPPDLLMPLRSRFGSYDLASWDLRRTLVRYHPAALAVTATLAIVIGVLGFIVFLAQRRAHAIAAARVSFVNRVSHELRTPLTNILLNIDLATELAEDDPQESTRRLDLVRLEARRLGRLIENVLTFSRAEDGRTEARITTTACVPADIVTAVIEQFLPGFQRGGLTIARTDENTAAPCLCDPDALAQILGNLLSNVEKYAPHGTVSIATTHAGGELSIRVTDEGPGIPREAAERIFHPFERIHSHIHEGATGTGLGLAIARDLATRLGGTLALLPTATGRGSCFELRVPAPPAPSPASASSIAPPA